MLRAVNAYLVDTELARSLWYDKLSLLLLTEQAVTSILAVVYEYFCHG